MKEIIKKRMLLLFVGMGLLVTSCFEEEERGPLFGGDEIPAQVTNVQATPMAGGAKISYTIPNSESIIAIEVSYTRDTGEEVTTSSSVFDNFVIIEGLREIKERPAQLVTVNEFGNKSQPVSATFTTLKAPIDRLFDSMELLTDFGGVRLVYDNADELAAEISLYVGDNGPVVTDLSQTLFISNDQQDFHVFRGYGPEEQTFTITVRDRFDNLVGVKQLTTNPLIEEQLDGNMFVDLGFNNEPGTGEWGLPRSNLWDGTPTGVFNTGWIPQLTYVPNAIVTPYTEGFTMVSIDLGVDVQLSRIKIWGRDFNDPWCPNGGCSQPYAGAEPNVVDLWGVRELPDPTDLDADANSSTLEGWTQLIFDGEVIKPSGLPVGENTPEDIAAAATGNDIPMDVVGPVVRYIRFVSKENWERSKLMYAMEIEFFGQVVE